MLAVSDDGVGLPPNANQGPGMGLRIMRYRSDVIGAELEVKSVPGKGTEVVCRCPVPEGNHAGPAEADEQGPI